MRQNQFGGLIETDYPFCETQKRQFQSTRKTENQNKRWIIFEYETDYLQIDLEYATLLQKFSDIEDKDFFLLMLK